MTIPIFETWTYKKIKFIAIPSGENEKSGYIFDEFGNNYGSWMSVSTARKSRVREN